MCFEQRPREDFEKADWTDKKQETEKQRQRESSGLVPVFIVATLSLKRRLQSAKLDNRYNLVVVLNDRSILDDTQCLSYDWLHVSTWITVVMAVHQSSRSSRKR